MADGLLCPVCGCDIDEEDVEHGDVACDCGAQWENLGPDWLGVRAIRALERLTELAQSGSVNILSANGTYAIDPVEWLESAPFKPTLLEAIEAAEQS